jgi:hypothetical protein
MSQPLGWTAQSTGGVEAEADAVGQRLDAQRPVAAARHPDQQSDMARLRSRFDQQLLHWRRRRPNVARLPLMGFQKTWGESSRRSIDSSGLSGGNGRLVICCREPFDGLMQAIATANEP